MNAQLYKAINHVCAQLSSSLINIDDEAYFKPCKSLFNATIGQHTRHIIELFQCIEKGYDQDEVNYDKRKRDLLIETNKQHALTLLANLPSTLEKADKPVQLICNYSDTDVQPLQIQSSYDRELAYNIEHTIHHMALIRVGLSEIANSIDLPADFGVAGSTMKYRQQCAQ